jgi:hypothetical protein
VIADNGKPSQLWDDDLGEFGTMTPEWSPPPLIARRVPFSAADKSITDRRLVAASRDQRTGFFVSWRRLDEMKDTFGDGLKMAGRIEPVDPAAAIASTIPEADVALSANFTVTEVLHHLGADISWMSDREVECWLHARAVARGLDAEFYGDGATAREAFAAIESVFFDGTLEAYGLGQLDVTTRVCRRRWQMELDAERRRKEAA